jgi:hypothetical protein
MRVIAILSGVFCQGETIVGENYLFVLHPQRLREALKALERGAVAEAARLASQSAIASAEVPEKDYEALLEAFGKPAALVEKDPVRGVPLAQLQDEDLAPEDWLMDEPRVLLVLDEEAEREGGLTLVAETTGSAHLLFVPKSLLEEENGG